MSKKNVGFRIESDLADELEKLAESIDVSASDLIRRALNHGIKPAIQEIAEERKQGAKQALKLVRDAGFEPATPTVSTIWSPSFA